MVFSRQGLPFSSRAVNQKGVSGQAQPKFFTRAWIDELRHASALQGLNGKLDFERDLWPMLLKEMCFAYHAAKTGAIPMFPAGYEPDPKDLAEIRRMIHPLEGRRFNDAAEYESEVRAYLEDDLNEAFGGNVSSPIKAATDMLRDVRDNIRYAVDFGGLTPESHAHFLSEFCPLMNRIAVGPPKERNMQLLALLDAGIVTLAPGPAPVLGFNPTEARFLVMSTQLEQPTTHYFDVLVRAKLDAFYPEQDSSPFIANALANKVIRPYRNGGFHPRRHRGRSRAERGGRRRPHTHQRLGAREPGRRGELLHLRAAPADGQLALHPGRRQMRDRHVQAGRGQGESGSSGRPPSSSAPDPRTQVGSTRGA